MSKYSNITNFIRGAVERNGLNGRELAEIIGMPYATLRYRYKYPGTWKFYEWGAVLRHVEFTPDELRGITEEIQK